VKSQLQLLWRAASRLIVFDLLLKLVTGLLVAPFIQVALGWTYAGSGSASITNADIPAFLLSPAGLAFLLLGSSCIVAAALAHQAGCLLILSNPALRPTAAIVGALVSLPRLATVGAAMFAWGLVVVVPLLVGALVIRNAYLSDHDINWYLATKPPEWAKALRLAAALAVPCVGVFAVLVVRWAFVVPVALFERRSGFGALRRSAQLIRGRALSIAAPLLGWLILSTLVTVALGVLFDTIAAGVLGSLGSSLSRMVATIALLGALVVGGFVLSLGAAAGYAAITLGLYPGEHRADVDAMPPRRLAWGTLAIGAAAAVVSGGVLARQVAARLDASRSVLVTAHRGSSLAAPENSIAAIRLAMEQGADYCEIDVQELRDGTIVVLHDTDLMRVGGRAEKVWEVDYADIRDLDSGSWFSAEFSDQRIATLSEVLDVVGDRMMLNIELKVHGHEKRFERSVVELLRERAFTERCVITSLDAGCINRVRELAPELVVGQIVTVSLGRIQGLEVDFLSMNASKATAARVRANRKAGLDTHVWTVNDREQAHRMIERGVDNIITDAPELIREVIDERRAMSDAELLLLALERRLRD
jgi:glycerophosphoryl diester phosphodiesterase